MNNSQGSLPVALLQSQLALNKIVLAGLHEMELFFKETKNYTELHSVKRLIAKYALLQKSLKAAIYEATYNARSYEEYSFDDF
jgi:hypothetical protein